MVVCEDDEATLELLCDHLTADRYRALAAPSASDALRLCHYKQPEPLLLVARSGQRQSAPYVQFAFLWMRAALPEGLPRTLPRA